MEGIENSLITLQSKMEGEVVFDLLHKSIYATDASVYRNLPIAVCYPTSKADLKTLIEFATTSKTNLIPRAAGTSLAGQCVGNGIVVDISKHFTRILAFDEVKKTITVEPGVIRDSLNSFLQAYGLFFGPNTSTSNRCTIGGMVGNNSSGTTSIKYGVTRDKVLALKVLLSDGNEVLFENITKEQFARKQLGNSLENSIYKTINILLSDEENQQEIKKHFPKKQIHRRNNGYAIDALTTFSDFGGNENVLNLSKLLCGSEGTLGIITEITLQLDNLPPKHNYMVAAHFSSIDECMKAVVIAMQHNLYTCELMDKTILDCTKNNREQLKNRFFVEGDPKAILMLEVCSDNEKIAEKEAQLLVKSLQDAGFGYAFPILRKDDINKALTLRKAGLGLLGNIIGDKKAVACIEDTAVEVTDLPNYISEFTAMMDEYHQEAVYYAHAGAGELHLRPILNLKKSEDVALFREITQKTALLVKKYGGSFSGEHGDGIVRSEFIPLMIGEKNYKLITQLKQTFDPNNIFNQGKIVNAFPMDENLRYVKGRKEPEIKTIQDFSSTQGILRAAENCNGSGDCRKLPESGGTMCPSYKATRNEKDTTRARANALREFLTNSTQKNKFNHKELFEVFDLCLSCKACASECPSNVDVSALKAEFLYQYYKENPIPFRTSLLANNVKWNRLGSKFSTITNLLLNTYIAKKALGFATKRSIPKLSKTTLFKWYQQHEKEINRNTSKGTLYLFIDEFSNYYDTQIAIDAIELLNKLHYNVIITNHVESGRGYISKGFLKEAKEIANKNINHFKDKIADDSPLVGIEPSAILTFKDDYLRLASDKIEAEKIAKHTYTFEEFIKREFNRNNIHKSAFTTEKRIIKIHGHCQQKSLIGNEPTFSMLSIPTNYQVSILNTGCCGMAGSFGYEKEHYNISMQIGEDSVFPRIRNLDHHTIIAASGTSCRHQIKDGTNRNSKHPISILKEALC